MSSKLDKGTITLIIFIIAATLLSAAQSVVTTGLADIMVDFGASSTTAQWIYSSFLLVLGVMIPTSAYITRRFKVRTILLTSLGLFFLASVIAYLAPTIEVLIFARVLQAIGSGVLLPITQIVIFKIVPEEKWQVYMGLFGFIIGIAPALAPTLGGIVIDAYSWREIFLIFAAITLVLMAIAAIVVKFEFETSDYSLDVLSLILCIVGCTGLLVGFSNISGNGLTVDLTNKNTKIKAIINDDTKVSCINQTFFLEAFNNFKEDIAKELGFPSEVKIIAGAGDNAAAAIGTGTVGDAMCNISLGTSGTIFITNNNCTIISTNAIQYGFCATRQNLRC